MKNIHFTSNACPPNYDESILSVASSVLRHYGVRDCAHKTLREFDKLLEKGYKNVLVMLFDGLGVSSINEHLAENDFLRRHMIKSISSVFPPTTTAATTTVQSGFSPAEHGWIGWDLYFDELDENVSIFSNTLQKDGTAAADYHVAGRYIPYENIFTRIEKANKKVEATYISEFSKHKISCLEDIEKNILKISKRHKRQYIYTYYSQPDHYMHKYGVSSDKVHREILAINSFTERLCKKLNDTLVIVTADHCLIDSEIIYLEDYPLLCDMLKRPPSVEPRALSLFVREGSLNEFKSEFNRLFGDSFILFTKEETLDSALFGSGKQNKKLESFIGDFFAVATGRKTILNNRSSGFYIGVHAGITKDEMTVPFIAVET